MQLGGDDDRSNVEDRRGLITGGRLGIGGIVLLGVLSIVFRQNFFALLGDDGTATTTQAQGPQVDERKQAEAGLEKVAVATFNDAQKIWSGKLDGYRQAKLVLFWDQTQSGCGGAGAEMGPFYCPEDERVYIDLGFYRELARRFGAPGDFAQAYVIAHEVGHHVQNLLGTMRQFDAQRQRSDERTANMLSVRLELQADCYAGVWGFYSQKRGIIDAKDIESGLRAAAAVGDDQIQKRTQGYVVPDSFTHGSAEERTRWFRTGLQSGDPRDCNTFNAR